MSFRLTRAGRTWWVLFALAIAAPALALAWFGLRAVGAERLDAERQLREQQRQIAGLADAAIDDALQRVEQDLRLSPGGLELLPNATRVVFEAGGLIVFPRDRVYFGPFGRLPVERIRLRERSQARAALIEEAHAAEIQRRADAPALFERIGRADPSLAAWAAIASARARATREPRALSVLAEPRWAESDGVTPSGLPAAFVACAAVDGQPATEAARFLPLLRRTLASLRAGRWWLSAEERRFYHAELSRLARAAGAGEEEEDVRLVQLQAFEHAVRQSPPLRRNAPTRGTDASGDAVLLTIWVPADGPDAWNGVVLTRGDLAALVGPALTGLLAGRSFSGTLRDASGRTVSEHGGAAAGEWNVEPLTAIPGSEMRFSGPASAALLDRQQWLWYGFVTLALVTLLAGVAMTAHVASREMELARRQSEFLGAVTHEFKSPLTSIRLLLERVTGGRGASPQATAAYHAAIGQEADRLERLVNRLLETQQIAAGRRQYAFTPESIEQVAAEAVAHLRRIAEARTIALDLHTNGNPLPAVLIDRAAVADAIENLVDNAIKYSRPGTRVVVRLHAGDGAVCVEVADQGIGIERDELPRVFDKFYRARRGDLQSVRGTGLGLALVKATAEAHGGTVEVESEPGVGSRFSLRLPLGTAA